MHVAYITMATTVPRLRCWQLINDCSTSAIIKEMLVTTSIEMAFYNLILAFSFERQGANP